MANDFLGVEDIAKKALDKDGAKKPRAADILMQGGGTQQASDDVALAKRMVAADKGPVIGGASKTWTTGSYKDDSDETSSGYEYEIDEQGRVKIVNDPTGRAAGMTLDPSNLGRNRDAYLAILEEASGSYGFDPASAAKFRQVVESAKAAPANRTGSKGLGGENTAGTPKDPGHGSETNSTNEEMGKEEYVDQGPAMFEGKGSPRFIVNDAAWAVDKGKEQIPDDMERETAALKKLAGLGLDVGYSTTLPGLGRGIDRAQNRVFEAAGVSNPVVPLGEGLPKIQNLTPTKVVEFLTKLGVLK